MTVKRLGATCLTAMLAAALCGGAGHAAGVADDLELLDPVTARIQACDIGGLEEIARQKSYNPDRVMIDQLSSPTVDGDTIEGDGGVFRSGGDWYRFAFTCRLAEDGMTIRSFDSEVEGKVPRDEWTEHQLFP